MYGKYAWNAGATAANVVADLLALMGGAEVSALSDSCNKASTTVAGAASPWAVVDAAYGVIQAPSTVGAGNKQARITATTYLQLAAVESWNASTHVAVNATSATQCGLALSSAGSVTYMFTPDFVFLAASDWSLWEAVVEVKRDGPLLGDVTRPNYLLVGSAAPTFPRLKNPAAAGDAANFGVTVQSAYGALITTATRDSADTLYIPMVPAVVVSSGVPVGEAAELMVGGGYGVSGDYMVGVGGVMYLLAKYSSTIFAFKRA